jgi:tetratricopeptide (TPR) repeat protein
VTLGEKVRRARKSRGLTQRAVGGGTLSESFISMLEHDKVRPSLETLRLIAGRLGVPLADLLDADPPPSRQVAAKIDLANGLLRQHRYTEAIESFHEAERSAGAAPGGDVAFRIQIGVGQALTGLRQFELAERHLDRAGALAGGLGRPDLVARVASATGFLSLRKRDFPAARDAFTHALSQARSIVPVDAQFEGSVLANLGRTYSELGLPAQALECFQASLDRLEPLGDLMALGSLHFNLGVAYERQQSFDLARTHLERAAVLFEAQENLRALGTVKRSLGILLLSRGQQQEGAALLRQSLALANELADDIGRAQTLTELARASTSGGELDAARAQAEEAIRLAIKVQDPAEAARAEAVMASICQKQGRLDEAAHRYTYALREFERLQAAGEVARVSRDLAFLLMERGDDTQAAQLFAKAFRAQEVAVSSG